MMIQRSTHSLRSPPFQPSTVRVRARSNLITIPDEATALLLAVMNENWCREGEQAACAAGGATQKTHSGWAQLLEFIN
jgi:hypothetical protein